MDPQPILNIRDLQGSLGIVQEKFGLLGVQLEGIHHQEA